MHYYIDVLKKYAIFKGRATRSEFWYFALFNFIVSIVIGIISKIIGDSKNNILGNIYSLAVFIPSLAVGMRRMHDIGKSGWIILINLIPIIGWIWFIVLACKEGFQGDNKYGPNPKGVSSVPPNTPMSPITPPQQEQPPVNTQ